MRWVLLILLGFARFGAADAQVPPNGDTLNSFGINGMDSNGKVANYWYYFPENRFIDSLRIDSIADRFAVGLYLQFPTEKAYRERDKFDPFLHEIYFRKARAQTWFFVVSLLVIFYLIYYRSVYQRQFELRVTGLYKPYFFEDLMREQQISSAAGSVHAFIIGLLVFSLGVMLYLINLDFNKLNTFLIFLLVLISWSGLSFFMYVLQRLFAFSMKIEDLLSRNFQRQINVNLFLALLMLPLFLIAYYNGTDEQDQWVFRNMYYVLIAWISLRLWVQFFGILRDGMLNLTSFLYFCTLEIIPYLLLIKFLQNSL